MGVPAQFFHVDPSAFSPVVERFTLPPVIKGIPRRKPVNWGSGASSEFICSRTSSRDGESWADVGLRVIEGTFSILKERLKRVGKPWDEKRMTELAIAMLHSKFTFRWCPPGRGEFAMGDDHVDETGSTRHCPLAGDTLVITQERGVVPIEALAGLPVTFLTPTGWAPGTVAYAGRHRVQELQVVPVSPGPRNGWKTPLPARLRRTVVATPDHPWLLANGTLTRALAVGDTIARGVLPAPFGPTESAAALAGLRHGLFFADGTRVHQQQATATATYGLRLCGAKAVHLEHFTSEPYVISYPATYKRDPYVTIRSALALKELPPSGVGADYLAGFIRGWLAGDGSTEQGGTVRLSTQDAAAARWLVEHAPLGGYVTLGVRQDPTMVTNFGERAAPLVHVRLGAGATAWHVEALTAIQDAVPVYCATVPGGGAVTLASGLVSGAGRST